MRPQTMVPRRINIDEAHQTIIPTLNRVRGVLAVNCSKKFHNDMEIPITHINSLACSLMKFQMGPGGGSSPTLGSNRCFSIWRICFRCMAATYKVTDGAKIHATKVRTGSDIRPLEFNVQIGSQNKS
jgi:hypothetical protein